MSNLVPRDASVKRPDLAAHCKQIDKHLRPVAELAGKLSKHTLTEAEIGAAKSQLALAKQVWAAVGRPASREEIAVEIAQLFACYPNLSNSTSARHLVAAMREDIVDERPSVYVVICACRAARQRFTFVPTIAEMLKELRKAKAGAYKHRSVVDDIPRIERELTKALPLLPRWRAERERAKAMRLKELRRLTRENPDVTFWQYDDEERELVRREVEDEELGVELAWERDQ